MVFCYDNPSKPIQTLFQIRSFYLLSHLYVNGKLGKSLLGVVRQMPLLVLSYEVLKKITKNNIVNTKVLATQFKKTKQKTL